MISPRTGEIFHTSNVDVVMLQGVDFLYRSNWEVLNSTKLKMLVIFKGRLQRSDRTFLAICI